MLLKNGLIDCAYAQNTGSEYIEADCREESTNLKFLFVTQVEAVFSHYTVAKIVKTRPERVMTVGNISGSSIADNFIVLFFFFPPTNQEVIFS